MSTEHFKEEYDNSILYCKTNVYMYMCLRDEIKLVNV